MWLRRFSEVGLCGHAGLSLSLAPVRQALYHSRFCFYFEKKAILKPIIKLFEEELLPQGSAHP